MRKKVDFLIVGTQKGGTTALDGYLRNHPEIGMAKIKEVHFFDDEEQPWGGELDYEKYHRSFPDSQKKRLGEATPIYMYWRLAPERIAAYNPGIRLIFLIRDPVERALSQWNMEYVRGREVLPFWDALQQEEARRRSCGGLQDWVFSYVDRGFYMPQIERMLKFFPRQQMLFLRSQDLALRHEEVLSKVAEFLNIAPFPAVPARNAYVIDYQERKMQDSERRWLASRFQSDISLVSDFLGWPPSSWVGLGLSEAGAVLLSDA